jgi:L-alanine-DL-glutamate epimerase-like enolase superfamily enzyme
MTAGRLSSVHERLSGGADECLRVVEHDVVSTVRYRDDGHSGFGECVGARERAVGLGQQVGAGNLPPPILRHRP